MTAALLYLLGIVVVAFGIAFSIALHEVGHLVPAKLFGVRVTQYMIGFGRTLISRRRGETEYGLKLIPLGGYISMVGMFPPAKAGPGQRPPAKAGPGQRPPAKAGHGQRPPASPRTGRRERLFAPTLGENVEAVVDPGDRAASRARTASTGFFSALVQDARTSSQDQIQPGEDHRAFYRLAVWKRIVIMLGGPAMNLLLGILFIGILLMGFGIAQPTTRIAGISACVVPATQKTARCTAADAKAPAASSGLKPGDVITAIDGTPVRTWADVTTRIRPAAGRALTVEVRRGSEPVTARVTPLRNTIAVTTANGATVKNADGSVQTLDVGFIGVSPAYATVRQPVTAVLPTVWTNVTGVAAVIVNLPQRLVGVAQAAFGSGERDPNGPISVVGVGRIAGQVAASDRVSAVDKVASLIGILGSLNIALFVFNLIPLLPLDGGHVIGALWEGLRRSVAKLLRRRDPGPVDTAKLMPLTFAVAILLGGMSLLLIYADIVRPISIL